MVKDDVFDSFDDAVRGRTDIDNPWQMTPTDRRYEPDYELLQTLLAIPIEAGSGSESGRLANAIDAWVATELRRAGFPADEVWPRLTKPRVLPREVGLFVQGLPKKLRSDVEAQLVRNAMVAPRDAKVLGRAYVKQVDVVIAQWSRGPELMVSTKSMVSSFGNNLKNRFEESYGDAKNLRARFPLAAIGFLFVFRSTILAKPGRDEVVYAPGFDRTLEQPIAGAIPVPPSARLIITEGNYLLFHDHGWGRVRPQLDEVWYVELDTDERLRRLTARHVRCGKEPAAAAAWATGTDERNAVLINATRSHADLIVPASLMRSQPPELDSRAVGPPADSTAVELGDRGASHQPKDLHDTPSERAVKSGAWRPERHGDGSFT